ncbi:MAG: Ribonuclease protein component [Cyanobacteriota bacterium]|jgi:ribonuclease P protein component
MLRWVEAQAELMPPAERPHGASPWRLGVVVSSKVHKRAVRRNRLRRLLHTHLLSGVMPVPDRSLWLLLSLKPGSAERDAADLLGECNELLQRAGLSR